MASIFKKAYFGKAYKTRDDRKAIYLGESHHVELAVHDGDDFYSVYDAYNTDGTYDANNMEFLDIVSAWEEPINEEELDKLANEFVQGFDCAIEISPNLLSLKKDRALAKSAFKVGYRKAKKQ